MRRDVRSVLNTRSKQAALAPRACASHCSSSLTSCRCTISKLKPLAQRYHICSVQEIVIKPKMGYCSDMTSSSPSRVLLAFDKFKGALRADQACDVVRRVLERERPHWKIDQAPISDGGDGFARLLTQAAGGIVLELEVEPVSAGAGPKRVTAEIGSLVARQLSVGARQVLGLTEEDRLMVVDMASVDGLGQRDPCRQDLWRSTTKATGELLEFCRQQGATCILLGVGGSCTNDLGLGALAALGLKFQAADGSVIDTPSPDLWPRIATIAGEVGPMPTLLVACDVDNPLLGVRGAAAVFGPQKGLQSNDLERLDGTSSDISRLLCEYFDRPLSIRELPGAGAAGGIAFGLIAGAGAKLISGFELIEQWLDIERRIAEADHLVTGEGCFDDSSWSGKGPGHLVRRAEQRGTSYAVLAGRLDVSPRESGYWSAISPRDLPTDQALSQTEARLEKATLAWLSSL